MRQELCLIEVDAYARNLQELIRGHVILHVHSINVSLQGPSQHRPPSTLIPTVTMTTDTAVHAVRKKGAVSAGVRRL